MLLALDFSSKFCQKCVTREEPLTLPGLSPRLAVEAGLSALYHLFCSAWALGSICLGLNSSSSVTVTVKALSVSKALFPCVKWEE